MGQYHYTVNLSKREFIHPHKLGDGLKLLEQCGCSPGGTNDALHLLLACSSGRGGGDFQEDPMVGRWAGDRIAVVGDYADDGDLPSEFEASTIYTRCQSPEDGDDEDNEEYDVPSGPLFTDITEQLIPVLERAYEIVYYGGGGWRERGSLHDLVEGWESSHAHGDMRVARIDGSDYPVDEIIARIKSSVGREKKKFTVAGITPVGSRTGW